MELKESALEDHAIVQLRGELDLLCAPALRTALTSNLVKSSKSVVLDLTALSFMDSSGLSELIAYQQASANQQSALAIVCAEGEVRELFSLSQLERYFHIFPSLQEACAHNEQQKNDVSSTRH